MPKTERGGVYIFAANRKKPIQIYSVCTTRWPNFAGCSRMRTHYCDLSADILRPMLYRYLTDSSPRYRWHFHSFPVLFLALSFQTNHFVPKFVWKGLDSISSPYSPPPGSPGSVSIVWPFLFKWPTATKLQNLIACYETILANVLFVAYIHEWQPWTSSLGL